MGRVWSKIALVVLGPAAALTGCSSPMPPSCVYSVSPTSLSLPPGGASAVVSVTTDGSCAWTAASNASWLAVTSGSTGRGNGTVSVSAGAAGQTPRSATLTAAGRTVTVSQDALPIPTFVLSGTVTDPLMGPAFGLSGVSVTARGPGEGSATTDSSGTYTIAGLVAGTYTVTFVKVAYQTATGTVAVTDATALPMGLSLDVPAGPSASDLTGYWTGTGSYPNNPFRLALIQEGAVLRGMYVDQHDASPSVSGSYAADEFVLSVNFGDAVLRLECALEDPREINGVQRTSALGNRPYPFTMKR